MRHDVVDRFFCDAINVVEYLTDSSDSHQYLKKMRQRHIELNFYWGTICTPLVLKAPDGKMRKTNCANTEGLFRIIQSIPPPKVEPFKLWLAKAAFGLTPSEHRNLKGLERDNLQDHMTDLELIFSALGEDATTEIARKQAAQGFDENQTVARKGGKIAGAVGEIWRSKAAGRLVTGENYLDDPESVKRL